MPPKDWRKGITSAMGEMLGEENLDERINEIKAIIERMDNVGITAFLPVKKSIFSSESRFRWDWKTLPRLLMAN